MIAPNFERMPSELVQRDSWMLWRGDKVPYQARRPDTPAKSNDPATWSDFDSARIAYCPDRDGGIGFAISGGVCAIDIDHDTSDDAIQMLRGLNCRYIERSPSGTGLHGWGLYDGEIRRHKGLHNGISVEIYNGGRYMTMTGDAIDSGALEPLRGVRALSEALIPISRKKANHTEENRRGQKITEDDCLFSSVWSVPDIDVSKFMPQEVGQRNGRLFDLARFLKGRYPNATRIELRLIVERWHKMALPVIGTEDFLVTWGDFLRGWEKVKYPWGETLSDQLDGYMTDPPPVLPYKYGETAMRLVLICQRLQRCAGDGPFFLSCRTAADLLKVTPSHAASIFRGLIADGVLREISKGSGNKASRYRFRLPMAPVDHGCINQVKEIAHA